MACRDAYQKIMTNKNMVVYRPEIIMPTVKEKVYRLLFGVDSQVKIDSCLQNNLNMFDWVLKNKIYPNFWGRNINGENALDREEIKYLHTQGCKILPYYASKEKKETEEDGIAVAEKAVSIAKDLKISSGMAIFVKIDDLEEATTSFMYGFAYVMTLAGYTPGFMANTDAKYTFDREFSRGKQMYNDTFEKCLIWATAPTLAEYDRMTTTHLIHPDNWTPFAPSGIRRNEIAIWQYGKDCHQIEDDKGNMTKFNLNLVRNEEVIVRKMF